MDLAEAANRYVLGQLGADALPAVAADALEAGLDSPSLRQLAGAQELESEQVRNLLNRALIELGMTVPSEEDAGLFAAKSIASKVIRGQLPPYEGARRIWHEVYTRFPQLTQLRGFVGLASEYEDDEAHRKDYSSLILEECRTICDDKGGERIARPS